MSCVSTDSSNFLPAGKKVTGHYMSGVSACSQYDIHMLTSMPGLDAGSGVLDSPTAARSESALSKSRIWVGRGFRDCEKTQDECDFGGAALFGAALALKSRKRVFQPTVSPLR